MGSVNRLNAVRVLKALGDCTARDHGLTCQEIARLVGACANKDDRPSAAEIGALLAREDVSKDVSPKTVRRIIDDLRDFGYEIEPVEKPRTRVRGGEVQDLAIAWRLAGDLDESELRFLADAVLHSRLVAAGERKRLIDKLCAQASVYFQNRFGRVRRLAGKADAPASGELFLNLELLDEAMGAGCMVRFRLGAFGVDGRLCADADDVPFEIVPFALVLSDDRYYLLGCFEPQGRPYHFRVDRIKELEVLCDRPFPKDAAPSAFANDPDRYVAEHLDLFGGRPVAVRMLIRKEDRDRGLHHVFDSFGSRAKAAELADGDVEVVVRAPEEAVRHWALQFAELVEVLEPASLRRTLAEDGRRIAARYAEEGDGVG